ncbi:MAG: class I SAM-dependent methyltransferase [PVC group bacterium]|nr:class I SAM-dependent methyltransferase [PVC group bacterium]
MSKIINNVFDDEILNYIEKTFETKGISILDVGAGAGRFGKLLKDFPEKEAVEVFAGYVSKYKLQKIYKKVHRTNISNFSFGYYDLIILGDMLINIEKMKAQKLITKLVTQCKELVVTVPYKYSQDIICSNLYEVSKQRDLTKSIFLARYPEMKILFGNDIYGVFVKKKNKA